MPIQSAPEHLHFLYNGIMERELRAMVKNNTSTDLAHGTLSTAGKNEGEPVGENA